MLPQKTYAGHFCQAHLINDFQEYWVPGGTNPDNFNDLSLIEVDTLNKLIFVIK